MALVPLILPPIMRLMATPKERVIRMKSLRKVGKLERIVFAVMVMVICVLVVPDASALIIMLMLGNIFKESGVVDRLVKTSQNELMNIVTIFLGTSVGLTMAADIFLQPKTLLIIAMGVVAFGFSTFGGLLLAKIMNKCTPNNPVNPLIGSAGVSAVPMAARVSQLEGAKYDPQNFLLMRMPWDRTFRESSARRFVRVTLFPGSPKDSYGIRENPALNGFSFIFQTNK